jgi:hypothetical protein
MAQTVQEGRATAVAQDDLEPSPAESGCADRIAADGRCAGEPAPSGRRADRLPPQAGALVTEELSIDGMCGVY